MVDEVEVDLEGTVRRRGISDVVRPRGVTYSGTFHQWLISGVDSIRTLPTICVHNCKVSRVPCQSASGNAGHTASSLMPVNHVASDRTTDFVPRVSPDVARHATPDSHLLGERRDRSHLIEDAEAHERFRHPPRSGTVASAGA